MYPLPAATSLYPSLILFASTHLSFAWIACWVVFILWIDHQTKWMNCIIICKFFSIVPLSPVNLRNALPSFLARPWRYCVDAWGYLWAYRQNKREWVQKATLEIRRYIWSISMSWPPYSGSWSCCFYNQIDAWWVYIYIYTCCTSCHFESIAWSAFAIAPFPPRYGIVGKAHHCRNSVEHSF